MTGSDLRHYRRSLKLSQAALAERWGVQRSTVQRWEANDRAPEWVRDALVGLRMECAGLRVE